MQRALVSNPNLQGTASYLLLKEKGGKSKCRRNAILFNSNLSLERRRGKGFQFLSSSRNGRERRGDRGESANRSLPSLYKFY